MRKRSVLLKALLGVAVLTVLVAAFAGLGPSDDKAATPRTAAVSRGVVLASVTATGNVTADTELGLNFASGGRLVEVAVKEGDRVTPGQVLARVDGRAGNDSLAAARADLAAARAELARVRQGSSVEERAANQASIVRAQRQVDAAQTKLTGAQAVAEQNRKDYDEAVNQAKTAVSQARARTDQNSKTYQADVDQAEKDVDAARRAVDDAEEGNDVIDRVTGARRTAETELRAARARLTDAKNTQRAGRLDDQQAVKNAQDEVTNATNRGSSGQLADQQAIRDATAGVGSAQADFDASVADARAAQAPASAAEVAVAQAGVAQAQAGVSAAQNDLDEASLVAPTAGTVASISNDVGELVGGSGVGGLGGVDSPGVDATGSSASAASTSTRGFIVLTDLGSLQVKAGFSEVDAARIRPGQAVSLTFEALPRQTVGARVAAIDTVSTLVRNVVTYNVTMVLDQGVEGVKPGMTSSSQVVVAERTDVPRLPNSAIGGRADRPTVNVMRGDTRVEKPVTVGVRGDESTEIVGGLAVGDRVLARAGRATGAAGSGG